MEELESRPSSSAAATTPPCRPPSPPPIHAPSRPGGRVRGLSLRWRRDRGTARGGWSGGGRGEILRRRVEVDPDERPERAAGGLELEPREVDGGEPAGGQDLPDEVDPGAWTWIPAEAFLRWPSPTLLPPRRSRCSAPSRRANARWLGLGAGAHAT
ncbi:unnamed protein product [Urochloa humidicola]